MALKLGKCRLCLKLGDFYSIFTMDNTLQLSEMAMECAQIKIYDGDGLPDKICSECVQKLSSAYIFKQQCERSDAELRRNYVPPPGFSVTPPPQNRQSSDSAFSSAHTDISQQSKPLSSVEKAAPAGRSRKRSHESVDDGSVSSRSQEYPSASKRVTELRNTQKKSRHRSPNASLDSDYEDNSLSQFSVETDSDEPLLHNYKCKICSMAFKNGTSLSNHLRFHSKESEKSVKNAVNTPLKSTGDANDAEDKLTCDKCSKTFKLKIMLKRHQESCPGEKVQTDSPPKELLVSLEPIDATWTPKPTLENKKLECEMCTSRFKTIENLEKHMRVVHAAILKKDKKEKLIPKTEEKLAFPCIYCQTTFDDYYVHNAHLSTCPKKDDRTLFECPMCDKVTSKKNYYCAHIKCVHFLMPRGTTKSIEPVEKSPKASFECRVCTKKLSSQDALIKHLAAHVPATDDDAPDDADDADAGASPFEDNMSNNSDYTSSSVSCGPFKCEYCDKAFKYKKALQNHKAVKHNQADTDIKNEPPDNPSTSREEYSYRETESDSSPGEGYDLTCDICEKQFSYKKQLLHHKQTKHHMSSGTKRAKINLKDCLVRCLLCEVEMKVAAINEHNQKHLARNIKPRNVYTCAECGEQFKSCSGLANHIKLIHRLKQQPEPRKTLQFEGADLADFCEVVVTKAEPLDSVQSHNGGVEVPMEQPLVDLAGFTCHLCGKTLKTLISLKRHVNWHTNVGSNIEKNIECFVCKETFRFQRHYRLHMRAHYTDTALDPQHLTCAICGRRSKHLRAANAHMNFHKQTRFKNKDYQCSICKRVFQYRKVYLAHMAIHYKRGEGQDTIVGDRPLLSNNGNGGDGSLQCPQCGKVCDTENSLKCHVRWHTSKSSLYGSRHECSICRLQFTNKRRLEIHTRAHFEDDNGPYKCTICGKGYIDEDYYRRHVKSHNFDHQNHKERIAKLRKNKVKCPICSRYYPDLVKLIRHLRRSHPESKMIKEDPDAPPQRMYSCKLCAKVFYDERRLKRHQETHLRKPTFFKCKFCGIKNNSLKKHRVHVTQRHLTSKYLDDPLKCPHCEEKFIRGYLLQHHIRDVHGIDETWIAEESEEPLGPLKEFQCSVCLKVLASKGNFERHLDYHNSLRCNYCFDYFSSLKFLEGHLAFSCEKKQLIGDTDPYPKKVKCHVCYKPFSIQVKLDCHLRTKHNIKVSREAQESKQDHLCEYCFKVFENAHALDSHKIYHRTIGYYGCRYCNRKFNTLVLFNKHKTSHLYRLHTNDPVKCEHCDETFTLFKDMIDHMKDVHGDDKDWLIMPKEDKEETCHLCKKPFWNLHRHMAYHEENRCKKCGEYFFSRIDFDNHLCAIESEDDVDESNENDIRVKYEECTFCFKPITRKTTKKLHDNLHSVSGAISCRFCYLKFKTIDAFNIHAFSHRSRKYNKKPIKCRICREKFVKYGPFIKHMKGVHKSTKKVHYRAKIKPERCVICGDKFPNLHNHYRCHLLNQCQLCRKYFTSVKVFSTHQCDKEDSDPTKVFTSDENVPALIKAYVPKDEKDDEKFYGYTDDEEEEEDVPETLNEESQNSADLESMVVQPFIISDVLSLYEKREELMAMYQNKDEDSTKQDEIGKLTNAVEPKENGKDYADDDDVVALSDDEDVGMTAPCPVITIDDD